MFLSWKRIFKILRNPRLTNKTFEKYVGQSGGYAHCATGELKEALKSAGYEFNGDKPLDASIKTLSHAFYKAIENKRFDEAETIYNSLQILANGDPC